MSGSHGRCLLRSFVAPGLPQITKKQDQFPTGVALFLMRIAPGRHAGQADAVLNDVVKLAVGEILRRRDPQFGRLGIQVAANHGCARTILAMAAGAPVEKDFVGLGQVVQSGLQRILFVFC